MSTSTRELFLLKVEGVSVSQGLLGGLFGYGDVILRGTGGTTDIFEKIKQPLRLHRSIQDRIMEMKGSELGIPLRDTKQMIVDGTRWMELQKREPAE